MVAGGRLAAALASLSIAGCGWIFPTGDLVAGDGGQGSSGGSGSGGMEPGGIDAAPICPDNQTVGFIGTVDGTDLGQFSGPAASSWIETQTPSTMDVYFDDDAGALHAQWNDLADTPVSAVCQLTLPDGKVYCGTGQVEGLANGASFYFSNLSAGPVCPNSTKPVSGSFVGCLNFNFM